MRFILLLCLLILAPLVRAANRLANCQPGGPCATPIEVRIVLLTMFEVGSDVGNRPGEFQLWAERANLTDHAIPFHTDTTISTTIRSASFSRWSRESAR